MAKITVPGLKECGACHDRLVQHSGTPEDSNPTDITELDKSAQNQVCGKCHYSKELFGRKAINPHHKHGLFMSVGFEGKKQQLSCLDCHEGHSGKSDMLAGLRAHTCFRCHKSAIVTMGVFQPFNYLGAGKVCLGCHAPHGTTTAGHAGRMTAGLVVTCAVCHIP